MKTTANETYKTFNEVQGIKASKRNWEVIILVKRGDYFEAYEEDAKQLHEVLGLNIFNRKGCLLDIAGFHKDYLPYKLPTLLRAGRKVSILHKA